MARNTVAEFLAKTLAAAGVERIWGVTGDSLNGLAYSLDQVGSIRWMHTRHEEVAAFAAGAHPASAGKPALGGRRSCSGAPHLLHRLYDRHRNQRPVHARAAPRPRTTKWWRSPTCSAHRSSTRCAASSSLNGTTRMTSA